MENFHNLKWKLCLCSFGSQSTVPLLHSSFLWTVVTRQHFFDISQKVLKKKDRAFWPMRSVIIAEVSFFSDQNLPKNFSQKCKKIPLPTLTFLIRYYASIKSNWQYAQHAQYIVAMQVPFQLFYTPHYNNWFVYLLLPFSRPFFCLQASYDGTRTVFEHQLKLCNKMTNC